MHPKIPRSGCAVLLALAGAVNPLRAQSPTPDPLEALRTAVQTERTARKVKPVAGAPAHWLGRDDEELSRIGNLGEALSRGDDARALTYLEQIHVGSSSGEVVRACDTLIEQIRRQQTEGEAALETTVDATLKQASESISHAKGPGDLDALLQELGRLAESPTGRYANNRQTRAAARLHSAITFVKSWQDYLLAQKRGDETTAANALYSLANNGAGDQAYLVPRSEILERLPAKDNTRSHSDAVRVRESIAEIDAVVNDVLDHTAKLDDMPGALVKLNGMREAVMAANQGIFDYNSSVSAATTELETLQKAYTELQAGLETTLSLFANHRTTISHPGIDGRMAPLRAELLRRALPRLLGAPGEKAGGNENVDALLGRLIEAAEKRHDWPTAARGFEIKHSLIQVANASSGSPEAEAFKQLSAGLNLEEAGQYEQATITYLTALKTGVRDLPVTFIGEHLAAIEKEHAKDYADANIYVLDPPAQTFPNGPAANYPRPGRGVYPGTSVRGPATALDSVTVPAVPTPTAKSAASPTP